VIYVGTGLLAGLLYAVLNWQTDTWAISEIGRIFVAFHAFVDRGIPLLAGGLAGLAFHWLHLRGRLARTEELRTDELRARLRHIERDQAAWVVAAAALHELKNPLHTLGLLVDELEHALASGDRAAAQEEMVRVRNQLDRALVPLDGLRALTRPNRTTATARRIDDIASGVVENMRPVARERGIELRLRSLATRPLTTEVDGEYLRIILDNLLANALEGNGQGPTARTVEVTIDADDTKRRVLVRVSDDGPGVPQALVDELFEPLRTDKSSGLGLGLPIARALARSLGGELARTKTAGFTTSFEVSLPQGAKEQEN
jgi:two-component system, NtrC family, C4-dicarboxylate transport sensor histidine kinase DctB